MTIQEYAEQLADSSFDSLIHQVLIKLTNYQVNDNTKNADFTKVLIKELSKRNNEGLL